MTTSYRHIQLLPPALQNQIAAGEVVERPASVVKELVENSLDAGSTAINITVENGGQTSIAIRDNGMGIPAADMALALTRHATSKISSFQELTNIASYGFRGEALPSIASVSILRMESAFKSSDSTKKNIPAEGYAVESHYGSITKEGPCALHEGTHIVIRDLFANVPARLKFLKTPATELRRCQDTVTRLALAQPQCSFTFSAGNREIFSMPAGMSLKDRLADIWPSSIVESLLPVNMTHHDIRVEGLVSAPHSTQGKSDRLLLYVNNRPVTDKLLISAVRQAYKGRLTSREYPQAVLFVTVDPKEIDVNVHPAKTEIRFRDERTLFSAVIRSIDNTFARQGIFISQPEEDTTPAQNPAARPLGFWGAIDSPPIIAPHERPHEEETNTAVTPASMVSPLSLRTGDSPHTNSLSVQEPYFTGYWRPTPENDGHANNTRQPGQGFSTPFSPHAPSGSESDSSQEHAAFFQGERPAPPSRTNAPGNAPEAANRPDFFEAHSILSGYPIRVGNLICLGQVATTYLILVQNDELLLMDQHAAHERVLLANIASSNNSGNCQLLALPEEILLHESEREQYSLCASKLAQLGYQTELAGDTLMVSGLPPLLPRGQALQLLKDILEDKTEGFDDIFHMMACRAAIKAGHILTADEAAGLLQQWLATPENMHCPHGRPIILRFGTKELEKLFKRTVG